MTLIASRAQDERLKLDEVTLDIRDQTIASQTTHSEESSTIGPRRRRNVYWNLNRQESFRRKASLGLAFESRQ